MDRWERFPDLHVYHFAPYEPAALKRLMGRYATREERARPAAARRALRRSPRVVRRRCAPASRAIRSRSWRPSTVRARGLAARGLAAPAALERALELGQQDALPMRPRARHRGLQPGRLPLGHAASRLAGGLRQGLVDGGHAFRAGREGRPSETVDEQQRRVSGADDGCAATLADPERREPGRAGALPLAHLLDWHRREKKRPGGSISRCAACPTRSCSKRRRRLPAWSLWARGHPKRSVDRPLRFPPQERDSRGRQLHRRRRAFAEVEAHPRRDAAPIDMGEGPSARGGGTQLGLQTHRRFGRR